MKVILNGATAGTNFGDFLFAQMFQDFVSSKIGAENVYWYRTKYSMSEFFSKRLGNKNNDSLGKMDALVYISGGYFCGNDKNLRDYAFRFLRYFTIGLKCIVRRIPIAIVGLEVSEPKSRMIKLIEKAILKRAKLIVVRNRESVECLNSYGISNVIESVDSAFVVEPSLFESKSIPSEIENCENKILLFHINPSISSNADLKSKIIPILNEFFKNHPEYAVLVLADQYSLELENALEDVSSQLICEKKIKYVYDDPMALCKVIEKVDTIVTHKLHVGLIGAKLGKSVISFSGHTEKIQRLYNQLGESGRSVSLQTLNFAEGCRIIEEFHDKKITVSDDIVRKSQSNFGYLEDFLSDIERKKQI